MADRDWPVTGYKRARGDLCVGMALDTAARPPSAPSPPPHQRRSPRTAVASTATVPTAPAARSVSARSAAAAAAAAAATQDVGPNTDVLDGCDDPCAHAVLASDFGSVVVVRRAHTDHGDVDLNGDALLALVVRAAARHVEHAQDAAMLDATVRCARGGSGAALLRAFADGRLAYAGQRYAARWLFDCVNGTHAAVERNRGAIAFVVRAVERAATPGAACALCRNALVSNGDGGVALPLVIGDANASLAALAHAACLRQAASAAGGGGDSDKRLRLPARHALVDTHYRAPGIGGTGNDADATTAAFVHYVVLRPAAAAFVVERAAALPPHKALEVVCGGEKPTSTVALRAIIKAMPLAPPLPLPPVRSAAASAAGARRKRSALKAGVASTLSDDDDNGSFEVDDNSSDDDDDDVSTPQTKSVKRRRRSVSSLSSSSSSSPLLPSASSSSDDHQCQQPMLRTRAAVANGGGGAAEYACGNRRMRNKVFAKVDAAAMTARGGSESGRSEGEGDDDGEADDVAASAQTVAKTTMTTTSACATRSGGGGSGDGGGGGGGALAATTTTTTTPVTVAKKPRTAFDDPERIEAMVALFATPIAHVRDDDDDCDDTDDVRDDDDDCDDTDDVRDDDDDDDDNRVCAHDRKSRDGSAVAVAAAARTAHTLIGMTRTAALGAARDAAVHVERTAHEAWCWRVRFAVLVAALKYEFGFKNRARIVDALVGVGATRTRSLACNVKRFMPLGRMITLCPTLGNVLTSRSDASLVCAPGVERVTHVRLRTFEAAVDAVERAWRDAGVTVVDRHDERARVGAVRALLDGGQRINSAPL